jgi:predicted O-methyltransferase YrrM
MEEYDKKAPEREEYLSGLEDIIRGTGETLEGNSFYEHQTFTRRKELITKQLNLTWCAREVTSICEIGFNGGHSAVLFLMGGLSVERFMVFDIAQHSYMKPCFEYIQEKFPKTTFELIQGDSRVEVKKWVDADPTTRERSFDLVHVDGGHSEDCVSNDFPNAIRLVKHGGLVVIDDVNNSYINNLTDIFIRTGLVEEVSILPTFLYPHRVLRKKTL